MKERAREPEDKIASVISEERPIGHYLTPYIPYLKVLATATFLFRPASRAPHGSFDGREGGELPS